MSIGALSMKIGIEVGGVTKYLDNINQSTLTYDVVDSGGEVIPSQEGGVLINELRNNEPNKSFIAVPYTA